MIFGQPGFAPQKVGYHQKIMPLLILLGVYIYIPDSHYPSRIPESNLVDPNSRWFTM